jgi:hypothetical protein
MMNPVEILLWYPYILRPQYNREIANQLLRLTQHNQYTQLRGICPVFETIGTRGSNSL